nr:hypothetical protein [Tanacetum cinerariifolium]
MEIEDSLKMDEHPDTIPKIELNEFIKSSVENLVPNLRIDETDCDPEEEIYLIEKLFDSFIEEIDLSFTPDDSMPPSIEEDDYNSERDILILEELLSNNSLSIPENDLFHFDIPSSSRPPAKPPDDDKVKPNLGILTDKVVDDIYELYVPMPRLLPI